MNDSIQIYNNLTGETIVREMTDEEQAQRNAEIAAWQLEKQAKQDAKQDANLVVPFKPVPFSPKATYVIGLRSAADGKKVKPDIAELHKKVVNRATSPTFKPDDPTKGAWAG